MVAPGSFRADACLGSTYSAWREKKNGEKLAKKSESGLGKLIMAAKSGIKFEIKFQKSCKNSKNGSDSGQKGWMGAK